VLKDKVEIPIIEQGMEIELKEDIMPKGQEDIMPKGVYKVKEIGSYGDARIS